MSELHVPGTSRDAVRGAPPDYLDHDLEADAYVRTIAAPVVAAELRRIADIWAGEVLGAGPTARRELVRCLRELRGRADYLAPDEEN